MKKAHLLLITIIISINVYAQSDWINYKMDNRIGVKLPAQPQQIQEGTTLVKDKDSLVYLTILVDFVKTANIDSAALTPYLSTQQFADGLKTGMLAKMSGSTMGNVKIDKWKGNYSYSIDGENTEKKLKIYTYMVIIGSKMYSLMVLVPNNKSPKGKDDFFNSLTYN